MPSDAVAESVVEDGTEVDAAVQKKLGLIEGGDNFLGEMSWPVAWDRVGVGVTPRTLYTCGVESWSTGEKSPLQLKEQAHNRGLVYETLGYAWMQCYVRKRAPALSTLPSVASRCPC